MNRIRFAVVCALAIVFVGVSTAAAQACNKTWVGGNGSWSEAGHWSPSGVPGSSESACITEPGTYTVQVSGEGGSVSSLTVGGSSGVQSVEVLGTSYVHGGETQRVTALTSASGSFAANTRLILDATEGGSSQIPSEEKGASAFLAGGPIAVHGQIETLVSDAKWDDRIKLAGLKIEPGASLDVASGTLEFIQEGEGAYPWSVTNEGSFTVAAGATVTMQPSFAGAATFTNDGAVLNNGSITGSATEWAQTGGSVSGNEVILLSGSTLVDSAGTGSFLADNGTFTLTGTIPAGQTVIVRGEPFGYGGETYYSTTLSGGGQELVNDGTLVLNPTGSGEASGGAVNVEAGSIHNNGAIDVETETASRLTQLQDSVTNGPSGHLALNGGVMQGNSGAQLANEGLVTVAPGAVYQLQEGASFINEPSGTFSPEIAGASSFGSVQLTSPCCNGAGVFKAGGTLTPLPVGGFAPAVGQEFDVFALDGGKFEGTFGTVAGGFGGDYAHESSEPAFVGVVYGGLPNTGPGGAPKGPTTPSLMHLASIGSSHGKILAKLSCPGGAAACSAVTLKATVVEHLRHGRITAVTAKKHAAKTKSVVIASASATLAAGATRTLTLTLNATGRALLAKFGKLSVLVTISSGTQTLEKLTVRLVKPPKPKKKK